MPRPSITPEPTGSVDAVTEALLTASRALVAVAARSLATVDQQVTLPQFRALVVLASRGPQHVGELASALAIHPSTATRTCDRLVAKKLVRRALDPENRRETVVSLMKSGQALVDEVSAIRRAEIAAIVARIPLASRAPMVSALATFADAAGELPRKSWSLGWS